MAGKKNMAILTRDGVVGFVVEHSASEGITVLRFCEEFLQSLTSKKGYAFLSKKVMRGERGERRAHHLPPAHRPPLGCGRRGQLRPPRIQQENEQVRILIQCDFSVQGLAK
ncbi:hypothetical protein TNIN_321532 [Trichonephila inaurata madagascariensis]|uniref:Choline/carnitine acyltransferase domain-containing protein n=1 Tax=Trichonephila inaurata madagascariensis TaxID=2747483 RepID=A0A8X6YFB0_9ARAC|nr:hypothetical protein TNIN_321532 [Trichonephila inaurata madagascariensis]